MIDTTCATVQVTSAARFAGLRSALLACASLALSCADTGQERIDVPLYLAGTRVTSEVSALGDIPVTIERADLAFGPLFLCAGNTAGGLCETARAEWLQSAVVDTTSDDSMAVGSLAGVTGDVRSFMYDLAISSQLTRPEPYVLSAAEELGDSSFVLEGRALIHGSEIPFSASIPIAQGETTERGVPVIRKGTESTFFHEISGREDRLTIRFDPSTWVSRLDLRRYSRRASCETSDEQIVCQDQTELICNADGSPRESRDCADLGQVCLGGQGCADELVIAEGSEAYRSLAIALTTTGRPRFEWTE